MMEKIFKVIIVIACILVGTLLFVPIFSLLLKIRAASFMSTIKSKEILHPLLLSIYTSAFSTLIAVVLGLGVSYVLTFKDIKLKRILDAVVTLPIVLPPSVAGYLLLLAFGRYGLVGQVFYYYGISIMFTKYAIIMAQVFVILPFTINSICSSFDEIDCNYQKVAEVLGASEWYIFKRIILPLSKGGILTGAILAFSRAMGEFGATMLVSGLNETMTIAIYRNAMSGKRMEADVLSLVMVFVSLCMIFVVKSLSFKYSSYGEGGKVI